MKMQRISQKVSKNIINNVFNFAFPLKISNFAHEIGDPLLSPLKGEDLCCDKKSSFYRGRILTATN